jgi:hypothetical protein
VEAVDLQPTDAQIAWTIEWGHVTEARRSGGPDPVRRPHAGVLQERAGTRRIPIYIGAPEATALAVSLGAGGTPRPTTYRLATSLL